MKSNTEDQIADHQTALLRAFAEVLRAEGEFFEYEKRLKDEIAALKIAVPQAEAALAKAWAGVAALMLETGEVELLLPGATADYKVGYGAVRESVKVENPDAVPDEFVKIERKPKAKEIGEHLRALRERGEVLPNWACLEKGVPKLTYRLLKKGAA